MSRSWMRVALAATLVCGSVALTADSAAATEPVRVIATSAATGTRYVATWSCAAGQVAFLYNKGPIDVEARFMLDPDGSATDTWLIRTLLARDDYGQFESGGDLRNDNNTVQRVILQDRLPGSASFTEVATLTVPDCPDYAAGTPSVFTAITPERVLDTRPATATNYAGAKPGAGATITIPASAFPDRPAGATAVSMALTGTEASGPGFLQAFPTGRATAGSSSNVNLAAPGVTVANLVVVPFGTDGSVSIFTSGGAHVLADVNGYFVAEPAPVAAGRLVAIDQVRVLDTRPATAVEYSGATPEATTITVDLTRRSTGLPVGAGAAVVNITATESGGPGFVQAAASGTLVPGASSVLNLTGAQQTVAGLAIVPLDASGRIDLYASGRTHLLVDVIGWFTGAAAAPATAGKFIPITPERVFDNRFTSMVNYESFGYEVFGQFRDLVYLTGVGTNASAYFINGTVTENIDPGFATFGDFDRFNPTSNINMTAPNVTVANAAIVAAYRGNPQFDWQASRPTRMIIDLAGYFTK